MLILLNLIIILFLLGMVGIWATYGLYSGFLHLVVVILSGIVAIALWEPVSYMLLGRMPAYAHGVGLLVPFMLSLILLRVAVDRLCRANVKVPSLANQIGGGACGLCSGILAMGMLLNGANFMPMPRDAFGWTPYDIQGNQLVASQEGGKLWLGVNDWSAGFYTALAGGSMKPSGPSLKEARPHLAQRALAYRMPEDSNAFRSAHPDTVSVTGVYAIPATPDAVRALVERATVFHFLAPGYTPPSDVAYDDDGTGLTAAIYREYRDRHRDSEAFGKPSEMIDIQAVMDASQHHAFASPSPTAPENFEPFVRKVAGKLADDLIAEFGTTLDPNSWLYIVDTNWNSTKPGTYNGDSKLRIALSQIRLQTRGNSGGQVIPPVGFSLQYSQNSGSRTFTSALGGTLFSAYAPYDNVNMGWAFVVPADHDPEYFYARELRFDLAKLPAKGEGGGPEELNRGAIARVFGAPAIPKPVEGDDAGAGTESSTLEGVQIASTGTFVELSEALPNPFSASAAGMRTHQESDPWRLISGSSERLQRGTGGRKSTVREIYVDSTDRLVRLKVSDKSAMSLYGRARAIAASLGVMQVQDERGNGHPAIGYALLKSNNEMQLDIRDNAFQGGLSASELPQVRAGDQLYVYFQVPISANKVTRYLLGSEAQDFTTPLDLKPKGR